MDGVSEPTSVVSIPPIDANRMKTCLNMPVEIVQRCFSPHALNRISRVTDLDRTPAPRELPREWLLQTMPGCEVLITGWGGIPLDNELLDACPKLKVICHSAGTFKHLLPEGFWDRGIRVTSAANANGIPVAEFLLGQILMAFKGGFYYPAALRRERAHAWVRHDFRSPGYYGSTVGIIGMGNVGKYLLKLLGAFQFRVLVHSFYPFEAEAAKAGATLTDVDTIMRESDAVVVAAPNIPALQRMFDSRRFGLMKPGAWFLNAARGALVDEAALIEALESERINACLDVTDPEPPEENSPLYRLKNCHITPHVAGSFGKECLRLGDQVAIEIEAYTSGKPFDNEIPAALAESIG